MAGRHGNAYAQTVNVGNGVAAATTNCTPRGPIVMSPKTTRVARAAAPTWTAARAGNRLPARRFLGQSGQEVSTV